MPSIHDYIDEIEHWRNVLADELNRISIYATRDEKLNTLVPKVLNAGFTSSLNGYASVIFGPTGQLATAALYGTATREEET